MKRTLLPAYSLESFDESRPGIVERFLLTVSNLHSTMRIPCTFFVLGRAIEQHPDAFRRAQQTAGEWIDFQQHTYSGIPLKTVCQQNHQGVKLFRGASPEDCREDIARASDIIERVLGTKPMGLAGPLGYYRGLSDHPEILSIANELGIRFTRTYTRNARDWSPVSFEVQPFHYDVQGFPNMIEVPGQGWPDHILRESLTDRDSARYVQHLKKDLNYVAAKELLWSFAQSDWSCVLHDPDMTATQRILEHAQQLGFTISSHATYCEENAPSNEDATSTNAAPQIEVKETEPVTSNRDEDVSPGKPLNATRWVGSHIRDLRRAGGSRCNARIRRLMRKAGSSHRHKLLHKRAKHHKKF